MRQGIATEFQTTLPQIATSVFNAVEERYYKVTSEAIRVCNAMIFVLRPSPESFIDDSLSIWILPLFNAIHVRLQAQDVDQEVKEHAIRCAGDLIAYLGDFLSDNVDDVLHILLERLRSETTRLTSVKALSVIAASPLELPLSDVFESVVVEFTVFLKKANISLRQASLRALEVVSLPPSLSEAF